MKKIIIIDDHQLLREGINSWVSSNSDWQVLAKLGNSREIQCSFYTNSNILLKKLNIEQKTHIYRIIQEAMTNAAKHANPSEIKVAVREDVEKKNINLFITDDGCGFINQTVKEINIEKSTKLGLKGMESRAILLNGTLQIQSDEETGTHIKLVVPVSL